MLRLCRQRFFQTSNFLKITPQIKHQVKEFVVSQSSEPSREEIVAHLIENGVDMSMLPTAKEIDEVVFSGKKEPKRKGWTRSKYTPEQLSILETKFKQNPFPTREDRKYIEKLLGIQNDQDQLYNWFSVKRKCEPNVIEKYEPGHKKLPKEKTEKIAKFFEKYGNDSPPREKIKDLSNALGLTVKQVRRWKNSQDRNNRLKQVTAGISKEKRKEVYRWLDEDITRLNPSDEQMSEGSDKFDISLQALNRIIMKRRIDYKHLLSKTEEQKNFVSINTEPTILQTVNKQRKQYYPEMARISIATYELLVKAYKREPFMSPHKIIKNLKKFKLTARDYLVFINNIDKMHGNNVERYDQGQYKYLKN